jgi:hypothetical protein
MGDVYLVEDTKLEGTGLVVTGEVKPYGPPFLLPAVFRLRGLRRLLSGGVTAFCLSLGQGGAPALSGRERRHLFWRRGRLNAFELGGLLRLGAFHHGELRGDSYLLGQKGAAVRHQMPSRVVASLRDRLP